MGSDGDGDGDEDIRQEDSENWLLNFEKHDCP